MPPRRKRTAATASNEDGPTKTKIKKEPGTEESDDVTEIDGVAVRWEWEADGNKWTQYSAEHSKNITEEYNSDAANMVFEVGGGAVKMKIVFGKMVQKNTKTGWERRIRCCCKDSASQEYYSWEWREDGGSWAPYNAATTIRLEKARLAGDSTVEFSAGRQKYDISLDKMQQINPSTNFSRAVRREASVAVADEAPAPVVKAPSKRSASAAKGAGDAPAAKGSSGHKGRSKGSKVKTEPGEDGEEGTSVRTVTMKGAAPVDPECYGKVGVAHVYSEGKDIYDAMLNQTNLSNNNNKYYLMQILKDDNKNSFSVWFRWGRVGFGGQNNLIPCGPDLDQAKSIFCKKFQDKTKNDWSNRSKFTKVSGKYDLVKIDYTAKNEEKEKETAPEKPMNVPDSKLDQRVQDLINLICDVKSMEDTVVEMKYDAKKAPLGKLTPDQIKAGYAALKKIDNCITNNDFGQRLVLACDEFYTRIPHCFGISSSNNSSKNRKCMAFSSMSVPWSMQRPPVIRTKDVLKAKIQLLEALGDIEIAMKIIKETKSTENPVDTHYNSLHCGLTPLQKSDPDFKMVEDYLQNTHAKTHNQYKMKILDIFCCDKKGEASSFIDHGNKMLLWHGSRLTNWVGILSQGLRIAPPEAPVTGYMFGKGVYFADMSSKSANYCFASQSKKTGLVLLCEVSLGEMNELLDADYNAAALPKGKHSVKGMGAIAPDPAKNFVMPNKTVVPLGKPKPTGVTNPSGYTLNYNEYIVYSTKQIKMKYLLKIEFQFK